MGWMAHRKWKEIKQQPGTAGPGNLLGCCFLSFHFLWAIHLVHPVLGALDNLVLGKHCLVAGLSLYPVPPVQGDISTRGHIFC